MGSKRRQLAKVGFSILTFAILSYAGIAREDSEALSRSFFEQDQSWRWPVVLGAMLILLRIWFGAVKERMTGVDTHEVRVAQLYSEFSDRVADSIIILGCALIAKGPYRLDLGWFCAIAAFAKTYVRTLGQALGANQKLPNLLEERYLLGALTGGCVLLAVFPGVLRGHNAMDGVLFLISVGSLIATWRSLSASTRQLRASSGQS